MIRLAHSVRIVAATPRRGGCDLIDRMHGEKVLPFKSRLGNFIRISPFAAKGEAGLGRSVRLGGKGDERA